MKWLFAFLCLSSVALGDTVILSDMPVPAASATATPTPTPLIHQGFEGTGYDTGDGSNGGTWTEAGTGTVDEDYTTSPIVGSQSLNIAAASQTASTSATYTVQDTTGVVFRYRWNSATGTGGAVCTILNSSGANILGTLTLGSSRVLTVQAFGGTANSSTGTLSSGTNYYIWVEVTKGTGANCTIGAAFSTTSTKPTITATGASSCLSTDGTATVQGGMIRIGDGAQSRTINQVIDNIIVQPYAIGSNP